MTNQIVNAVFFVFFIVGFSCFATGVYFIMTSGTISEQPQPDNQPPSGDSIGALYAQLNEIDDQLHSLASDIDDHHCPDYCSGSGLCTKCQLESDYSDLSQDYDAINAKIEALEAAAG